MRGFIAGRRRPSAPRGHDASPPPAGARFSTARQTIRLLVTNYFEHNVGQTAAALAYYLLFAMFPLLIFVSNLLGLLHLDAGAIAQELLPILPQDVVNLLKNYLEYVSQNSSQALLWFSLVFTVYFPMRATRGLMNGVRTAYQLEKSGGAVSRAVRQLIYTLVLLVAIVLALVISTLGRRVLAYLLQVFPGAQRAPVLRELLGLWHYLRFVFLGAVMFAALGALYAMAQDRRQPLSAILPGGIAALVAWLAVSIGFSFYVDHFANYSVIYGTLGAMIVLLIWLYLTSMILILGAEFNAALRTVRAGARRD